MSGTALEHLKQWNCVDLGDVPIPEYAAVNAVLLERLTSSATKPGLKAESVAFASLGQLVKVVEEVRRRIMNSLGNTIVPNFRQGRIQIVNWRKHGDDESYCRVDLFAADDPTDTESLIENDWNVRADAEDEGDYEHTYYVNDSITIADGDVKVSNDGRRFRITIAAVD